MPEVWLPTVKVVPSKKTDKPTKRWFPFKRKSGPRTRVFIAADPVYPPSDEEFAEMRRKGWL